MKSVTVDIQIRFADADILGHVNNVNIQHYFDLGKNQYMYTVLGMKTMLSEQGMITAATNTSYFEQTRLSDLMMVETTAERIGTKSITMGQKLVNRTTGVVHAQSSSVMVAFDFTAQQTIILPAEWVAAAGQE